MANEEDTRKARHAGAAQGLASEFAPAAGSPDGSKSVAPIPEHTRANSSAKKAEEPPPVPYFQQRKQAVQEAMEMAKGMNPMIAPELPENPLKVFPVSHATKLLKFAQEHWDDSTANEYIQHLQAAHEEFVRGKETEPASPPAQLPEEQVRTVAFE